MNKFSRTFPVSYHPKCDDWVVAFRRWSLTGINLQGWVLQGRVKITQSSCKISIQIRRLKSKFSFILLVHNLMIWCCEKNRQNYPKKCFWTKEIETRVNPGLALIGLRTTGPRESFPWRSSDTSTTEFIARNFLVTIIINMCSSMLSGKVLCKLWVAYYTQRTKRYSKNPRIRT